MVATDTFSRWTNAFPITNGELGTIAPILETEVFMRWGYPRALSDNGPQFRGPAWERNALSGERSRILLQLITRKQTQRSAGIKKLKKA